MVVGFALDFFYFNTQQLQVSPTVFFSYNFVLRIPLFLRTAKNLISALLNIDPTLRFSMAQALKYIPSFRIGQEKEKKEDCFAMPSPISLKRQNTKENEKRNHPVSRTSTNNSTSLLSNSVKPLMKAWGMLRSHTSPQHAIILNKSQISIGRSPGMFEIRFKNFSFTFLLIFQMEC